MSSEHEQELRQELVSAWETVHRIAQAQLSDQSILPVSLDKLPGCQSQLHAASNALRDLCTTLAIEAQDRST